MFVDKMLNQLSVNAYNPRNERQFNLLSGHSELPIAIKILCMKGSKFSVVSFAHLTSGSYIFNGVKFDNHSFVSSLFIRRKTHCLQLYTK